MNHASAIFIFHFIVQLYIWSKIQNTMLEMTRTCTSSTEPSSRTRNLLISSSCLVVTSVCAFSSSLQSTVTHRELYNCYARWNRSPGFLCINSYNWSALRQHHRVWSVVETIRHATSSEDESTMWDITTGTQISGCLLAFLLKGTAVALCRYSRFRAQWLMYVTLDTQ